MALRCLVQGNTSSATAVSNFIKELSRVFPEVYVQETHFAQKFNTDGIPQSIAAVCKVLQALQYKNLKQAVEHQAVEHSEFFVALFVAQQSIKTIAQAVCTLLPYTNTKEFLVTQWLVIYDKLEPLYRTDFCQKFVGHFHE